MRVLACVFNLAILTAGVCADDWRQFRGNDSSGVSPESNLPVKLEEPDAIRWKTPLPGRGISGPVVVGDRVFLTASSGYRDDQLHVLCYSTETGEQLWRRRFKATGRTICNEAMCMATPQPCSDGERIYAYYSCNDVVCLDLDGNLIWYRGLGHDYPKTSSSLGMSSSPIVVDGTLVLQLDTDSESFAAGLDALTGETQWKTDRNTSSIWASPTLFRPVGDGAPQIILQSTKSLQSIDHRTGKANWSIEQTCGEIPSTTVAGNLLLAPLQELSAIRPDEKSQPEIIWSDAKLLPDTPTPVAYGDRIYVLKDSVLWCASLKTGQVEWRMRLECEKAYASPLAANGHLYLVDEHGVLQSVRIAGKKGEVVSRLELGEAILATPALAHGGLYLRSDRHLWKFANAD